MAEKTSPPETSLLAEKTTSSKTPPIDKGDIITTDVTETSNKISVTWKQKFKRRTAEYYSGQYTNFTKTTKGQIFVQKDWLEKFKDLTKDDGKITVGNDFKYGQKKKDGTNRWIVFHDKDNLPYQHRFVTGLAQSLGASAADAIDKIGYVLGSDIKIFINQWESYVGDKLHDWDDTK